MGVISLKIYLKEIVIHGIAQFLNIEEQSAWVVQTLMAGCWEH